MEVDIVTTVTVSPKYHVVIPSEVRESLKLKPGQKMAVVEKDGVVHLIPIKPLKELRVLVNIVFRKTKKSYFGAARGVGPFTSKDEMKTHD